LNDTRLFDSETEPNLVALRHEARGYSKPQGKTGGEFLDTHQVCAHPRNRFDGCPGMLLDLGVNYD